MPSGKKTQPVLQGEVKRLMKTSAKPWMESLKDGFHIYPGHGDRLYFDKVSRQRSEKGGKQMDYDELLNQPPYGIEQQTKEAWYCELFEKLKGT